MNIQIDIKGVDETIQKLNKIAKDIDVNSSTALQDVANLGFAYATTLSPFYTGATRAAMHVFPRGKTAYIIQSNTSPSDNGFPINLLFDLGTYSQATGQNVRRPSSIGFMQKTAQFLESEFANRMRLAVSRSVK